MGVCEMVEFPPKLTVCKGFCARLALGTLAPWPLSVRFQEFTPSSNLSGMLFAADPNGTNIYITGPRLNNAIARYAHEYIYPT